MSSTYPEVLIDVPEEEWLVMACGVYLRVCTGADNHPSSNCPSNDANKKTESNYTQEM